MDKLIIALIEVSVTLTIFYLYFILFLKKQAFFGANRWFLLGASIASLVLPFLQFNIAPMASQQVVFYNVLDTITITAGSVEKNLAAKVVSFSFFHWIVIIYLLGVAVRTVMFLYQLLQIAFLRKKCKTQDSGTLIVFVENKIAPFSFLNRIYIHNDMYADEELKEIIAHEQIHVGQRHTYDCLFYEFLIIVLWFHPLVYRYRTEAKEVHEFLADQGAIRSGIDHIAYQQLLFAQTTGVSTLQLPNSFNYSLLKRRIIMMTQNSSSRLVKIRFVWLAPVVLSVLIVFACNKTDNTEKKSVEFREPEVQECLDGTLVIAQHEVTDSVYTMVETMPEYPGGQEALRNFIYTNVKYPEIAKEKGIQGKVYVQFVVNSSGDVEQVKLARGVDPIIDEEAIRVVKSLPQWKPGEQKGIKVSVTYTVPINFALK
jgi:TonB family protein